MQNPKTFFFHRLLLRFDRKYSHYVLRAEVARKILDFVVVKSAKKEECDGVQNPLSYPNVWRVQFEEGSLKQRATLPHFPFATFFSTGPIRFGKERYSLRFVRYSYYVLRAEGARFFVRSSLSEA